MKETGPLGRILVPIADERDAADTCDAIESYLTTGSEIVVVHVIEKTEGGPDKAPPAARKEQATTIFSIVEEWFAESDIVVKTALQYGPDVIEELLDAARTFDVSALVFTPRPGARWIKLVSGGFERRLLTEIEVPVIFLPHPDRAPPRPSDETDPLTDLHALVPVDGSAESWNALEYAVSVYPTATITAVHVLESVEADVYETMTGGLSSESTDDDREVEQADHDLLNEVRDRTDDFEGSLSTVTLSGEVSGAILASAEERDVDVIVIGRSSGGGLRTRLFGSITESVVEDASVPVTIVR